MGRAMANLGKLLRSRDYKEAAPSGNAGKTPQELFLRVLEDEFERLHLEDPFKKEKSSGAAVDQEEVKRWQEKENDLRVVLKSGRRLISKKKIDEAEELFAKAVSTTFNVKELRAPTRARTRVISRDDFSSSQNEMTQEV